MAIRFDAGTDILAGSGVTGTVATVTCWARIAVNRLAHSNIWIFSTGATYYAGMGTQTDGLTMELWNATQATVGPTMVVGTWYCFGAVLNGTAWTLYHGTSSNSLTAVPATRTAISSPSTLATGDPSDFWNGDLANLKIWTRALTQADVTAELQAHKYVVNSTSLIRHHPFFTSPGTTNSAGSGANLTAGSTATATAAGPPGEIVPSRASQRRLSALLDM